MKVTKKIWGERWLVHEDSTHTTNILILKAGYRCSWHHHKTKWNLFLVLEGLVGIKTKQGIVTLHEGQQFEVAPGTMHEFQVYESGSMLEIMFVKYDDDDIEREILGSVLDLKKDNNK